MKIGIIGAGCYGTALAQCFAEKYSQIFLFTNLLSTYVSIQKNQMNLESLPGIKLHKNINCIKEYSILKSCDLIFLVTPVSVVTSVCDDIKKHNILCPIILCSKGFDSENVQLLSKSVEKILTNEILILSGPSFAHDIACGRPAAVNLAGKNFALCNEISQQISTKFFQIKAIEDYIGLQIAGAMKNIAAVGCGILNGLNLGNSAIAKFITQCTKEMCELSERMGGTKNVFFELGGLGDIILTCTSSLSRNFCFGSFIGNKGKVDKWDGSLAEGAVSLKNIPIIAGKYDINLPCFLSIYEVVYGNQSLNEFIASFFSQKD